MADTGPALVARLHTAAGEVSGLLRRLASVRPAPPITSQDRRRVAEQADASTAELERVCDDLDAWIAAAKEPESFGDSDTGAPVAKLADVSGAQETLDAARADLHHAVEGARAGGASWREIGEALGITPQTAHKRFDPKARQRHADYMRARYQSLRGREAVAEAFSAER